MKNILSIKTYARLLACLLLAATVTSAYAGPFPSMFSIPVEPATLLGPSGYYEMIVPKGKGVVITDIYVKNLGGEDSHLDFLEQRGPDSYEYRYRYEVANGQTLNINLTTGLRLGDQAPIAGKIRVQNGGSTASFLVRVNGYISSTK